MANPPTSPKFDWKMYRYVPSLPAAILFLILFIALTMLHVYSYIRHRKTSTIYVILGGLCEIAGFAARIGSHYNNASWAPFIIQGTLLLVGPLFFAATVYMMLGRTIRYANAASISRISPKWCTRVFVAADISTLIVQGLGASLMGTMKLSFALAGEKVVIAGLALQVATFVIFTAAAVDFHVRMKSASKTADHTDNGAWRKMLHVLYTLSSLILFRCIFRLIEYSMGNAAYLIAHEWTLYVFDGVPMSAVLALLFVWRPKEENTGTAMKGRTSSDGELGDVESQ
ncbi:RTA1 like protein-domain-containing protein [Boeremia exigua]|uniref:RTA1 like protein-domain-containing protein n=1 Tax=Boeremia exigua TaxID=749465 RepID=UPI001E8DCEBD|nr:RTA1 like protein-domain-containing protein [Boeremia exigua]KAH6642172.1 RTA1 like protein-domain-containing protein [Boeremia exigua]